MTHAQRVALEHGLQASRAVASRLFESHSPQQLRARPAPRSWSAAECVDHLCLTAAAFVPRLESALGELREKGMRRAGPSRMDWTGRLLNWSLQPRPWPRMKTTASFQPLSPEPLAELLPRFLRQHDGVIEALRAAEGFDLEAVTIASPFNERLRYNLYTAFRLIETHDRRHLRQAEAAVARASSAAS